MQQTHCTIEKVAVLPGSVGYIKLNSFPEPAVCEPQIRRAMGSIDNTAAIIFDLRDNRGGDPAMTALVAAYLFPRPVYWYNPRGATAAESWLSSPVSGSRLANKPVYILTSVLTLSGAEQFSYDLKMLHRATLVGETTGGAAHAGVFHRIDDHFGIGIPEVRVVNPYSRHDWEVVGVTPDVRVQPPQALATAQRLAEAELNGRVAHPASSPR
jgi:C-terminal processing protease CtpA/Prc